MGDHFHVRITGFIRMTLGRKWTEKVGDFVVLRRVRVFISPSDVNGVLDFTVLPCDKTTFGGERGRDTRLYWRGDL